VKAGCLSPALTRECGIARPHHQGQRINTRAPLNRIVRPSAQEITYRPTHLVDSTTSYGLTGAVFAEDRTAIAQAFDVLRYTAGNFYVNDKPTGSVVGHQPFGGARASGTNDKAGTVWNLIRFASPRTTKENHLRVTDFGYPHLDR